MRFLISDADILAGKKEKNCDMLICACVANHHNSEGPDTTNGTEEGKMSYTKLFKFRLRYFVFLTSPQNLKMTKKLT
jgi:hypothetical protein